MSLIFNAGLSLNTDRACTSFVKPRNMHTPGPFTSCNALSHLSNYAHAWRRSCIKMNLIPIFTPRSRERAAAQLPWDDHSTTGVSSRSSCGYVGLEHLRPCFPVTCVQIPPRHSFYFFLWFLPQERMQVSGRLQAAVYVARVHGCYFSFSFFPKMTVKQ